MDAIEQINEMRRRPKAMLPRGGPQTRHGSNAVRWRCSLRPDAATLANTKGEAIAFFKKLLSVDKLPHGSVVEKF